MKITIYQGAIKGERFEYFLEKVTELGVDKICVTPFKRNVVKFTSSKQSRRIDIPKIEILDNMIDTVSKLEKEDAVFILYEKVIEDTINIKDMLANIVKNNYTNIALVIGAEGGIDETEIEKFRKLRNIRIVTLGERILRAETTGPSVLSILNYELGR